MLCSCNGKACHMRAQFAGLLGDEKGLKELYSTKGSSGTKCCLGCNNIVTRMNPADDPTGYIRDVRAPPTDIDPHSDQSVSEMTDALRPAAGVLSAKRFNNLGGVQPRWRRARHAQGMYSGSALVEHIV